MDSICSYQETSRETRKIQIVVKSPFKQPWHFDKFREDKEGEYVKCIGHFVGDWKDDKKHGNGFESVGDGILIGVNYENGVKNKQNMSDL